MKGLVKYCIVINILLLFAGCSRSPYRRQFADLQPLLEQSQKVDSCLQVLQGIDTTRLVRNADKARFSLLYAMALDKNYIDTTDLSVLKPAIDRYLKRRHLCRRDKFYTWYYRGRIEENARENDASLTSYLMAERYMGSVKDVYKTRLYFGLERVYIHTISHFKAHQCAQQALKYAKSSADSFNICVALSDCASGAAILRDEESAIDYFNEYNALFQNNPAYLDSPKYLRAKMVYFQYHIGEYADSARYYLNRYLSSCINETPYYPSCLLIAISLGDFDTAVSLFDDYEKECHDNADYPSTYYYIRYKIREHFGDITGAFDDLRRDKNLIDRTVMFNLDNEIQSMDIKYKHELSRMRVLYSSIACAAIFIAVLLLLLLIMRKRQYRYSMLQKEYFIVKRESDFFTKNREDNIDRIGERVIEIAKKIGNQRIRNVYEASKYLSGISGSESFAEFLSFLTVINCNHFLSMLVDKNLDKKEVSVCVLLLLNVRVNELEDILQKKSSYNLTRDIRAKLGFKGSSSNLRHILENMYAGLPSVETSFGKS